jgi:hypothetical protein
MGEKTSTPDELGPYLNSALICEKVLQERDGVTSAIRIIDRLTHTTPGGNVDVMDPFPYQFYMLLGFKSGEALGNYQVSIQPIKPEGTEKVPPAIYTVNFEAPADRGVGICAVMQVQFDVPGLWWFDIYLTELTGLKRIRRVTRIPLRIIYLPQQMQMSALPG